MRHFSQSIPVFVRMDLEYFMHKHPERMLAFFKVCIRAH